MQSTRHDSRIDSEECELNTKARDRGPRTLSGNRAARFSSLVLCTVMGDSIPNFTAARRAAGLMCSSVCTSCLVMR